MASTVRGPLSPLAGRGRVGEADRVRGRDLSGVDVPLTRAALRACSPLPAGERVPVPTSEPDAMASLHEGGPGGYVILKAVSDLIRSMAKREVTLRSETPVISRL